MAQAYVSVTTTNMAAAITANTAYTAISATTAKLKSACFDNGFNVDVVAIVGGTQVVYLRAGKAKIVDLYTDNEDLAIGVSVALFAPGGSAPSLGTFLIDCMF